VYLRIEPILCSLKDGGETHGVVQRRVSSSIQQNAHALIPVMQHCNMESCVTINVLERNNVVIAKLGYRLQIQLHSNFFYFFDADYKYSSMQQPFISTSLIAEGRAEC